MHLKILRSRPDIRAVVHAHPLHASLLTAAEKHIPTDILAEARFLLGQTVFVPYALMGTDDLGSLAAEAAAGGAAALMLENHGVLTVGGTLLQAFDRMEVLEAAAAMHVKASPSLQLRPMDDRRLKEIDALH
jgi:L-fuculose-phosphate aldolase